MNPGEVMVIRQPGRGESGTYTSGWLHQKDIEIAKLQNRAHPIAYL